MYLSFLELEAMKGFSECDKNFEFLRKQKLFLEAEEL
jgi:hypothetical protein